MHDSRKLIPLADFRTDKLDDGATDGDLVASAFRLLLGRLQGPFASNKYIILELEAFLLVERIGTLGRADFLHNVTIKCGSSAARLG